MDNRDQRRRQTRTPSEARVFKGKQSKQQRNSKRPVRKRNSRNPEENEKQCGTESLLDTPPSPCNRTQLGTQSKCAGNDDAEPRKKQSSLTDNTGFNQWSRDEKQRRLGEGAKHEHRSRKTMTRAYRQSRGKANSPPAPRSPQAANQ